MNLPKSLSTKSLSAVAALVACLGVAAPAHAEYSDFCVDETSVSTYTASVGRTNLRNGVNGCVSSTDATVKGVTVDYLNGKYVEKFRINNDFSFDATIVANWSAFYRSEGENAVIPVALGSDYQLYAVVTASGNFVGGQFVPSTGSLKLYANENIGAIGVQADLSLGSIDSGSLAFTLPGGDTLLATAQYAIGTGTLTPTNLRFGLGFDQFDLTDSTDTGKSLSGESYFIAPRPFHLDIFSDGDISVGSIGGPTPIGTPGLYTISGGDLSAVFERVPEPGSLALVGLALAGLGFVSGRRKAQRV